jgi:hypothetical protein
MYSKIINFDFKNLIFWSILYSIIFFIQLNSFLSFAILIFPIVGLFFTFFISRKSGFIFFLLVIFIFDDHSYNIDKSVYFASIDVYTLFGQTISKLWTFIWVIIIFFDLLKRKVYIKTSPIKNLMVYLLVTSFIVGVINGNLNYFKEMINDSRIFVNFFVGFMGIALYLSKVDDILKIIRLIVLVFLSKIIVFISFLLIILQTTTIHTISSDTSFYLVPTFIIVYSILSKNNSKIITYLGIILCIIALGISASRGKIFVLLFQLFIYLYAIGKLTRTPLLLLFFLIPVTLIPLISPEIYRFLIWKLTSFSVDPEQGMSTYIRFIELKNIISINLENIFNFIFGSGLGGYWDSSRYDYVMPLYDIDAYPDEWIYNDKFFKPHGNIIFFLLKFGFVGTIYFYFKIFNNFIKQKRIYKKSSLFFNNQHLGKISIAIFTGIITLSIVAFSSKLQLIFGVFAGFCAQFTFHQLSKLKQLDT